ncbi:MAG: hypothetical protein QMD11_00075 [Smithella sp.]|nr:hypothetical protein [Smithella sp.]
MARMSRDSFAKSHGAFKTAEELEKEGKAENVPEKTCGLCKNFLETAAYSDGRGSCKVLKEGSDIICDPPVLVMDGKNGYQMRALTDAAKCSSYAKMEFIDHDGTECSDPQYRRTMRQFQDK